MLIMASFHILTSTSHRSPGQRYHGDINDSFKYISDIVVPVTLLLPSNICKCTANQVEQLRAAFPQDLEEPDALLAEMEVIGGSIE